MPPENLRCAQSDRVWNWVSQKPTCVRPLRGGLVVIVGGGGADAGWGPLWSPAVGHTPLPLSKKLSGRERRRGPSHTTLLTSFAVRNGDRKCSKCSGCSGCSGCMSYSYKSFHNILTSYLWGMIMGFHKLIRQPAGADQSAVGAMNRPLRGLCRLWGISQ